jgi:hypothetical protein
MTGRNARGPVAAAQLQIMPFIGFNFVSSRL